MRDLDANNNLLKEYVRGLDLGGGIGSIIYQKKSSDYYYYHYNHKGDVVALTDGNAKLAAFYEYDAWGNVMTEAEVSGVDNPYRYSTKEWDEKSGLYYFGFRYYCPEIGRWTQRDPAGIVDGLNLYVYATNEPVSRFGPWGLDVPSMYPMVRDVVHGRWPAKRKPTTPRPPSKEVQCVRERCNLDRPDDEIDGEQIIGCCRALLSYFRPIIGTGTGFINLKAAFEQCLLNASFPSCTVTGKKLVTDFAGTIGKRTLIKILFPSSPPNPVPPPA